MTTMNDKYGDGSTHEMCETCGYCIICGDCETNGCGKGCKECRRLRELLTECAPHVFSAAEAEHLLDGFRPQKRPLDAIADRVRAALTPNVEFRGGGAQAVEEQAKAAVPPSAGT